MSGKPNPTGEQLPKTGDPFIDSVASDAIKSQRETGVPASVTLAQALIESNRGKSGLSRKANNYFGIKGKGPAGSMVFPTREVLGGRSVMVNAPFRKYNSASESFADHGRFFIVNKRYHKAMQSSYNPQFSVKPDAHEFARQIKIAGYATDPLYAKTLISIIDRYNLTRFDQIARSAPAPQPVQPQTPVQPPPPPPVKTPTTVTINAFTDSTPDKLPPPPPVKTPAPVTPAQTQPTAPSPPAQPATGVQLTASATTVTPPKPPTGAPTVGAQTDSAQPDAGALRLGMRGPEVGRLQDELILLGYLTLAQKLSGPGVFGPKTQTALMGFQRDNHLAVNGIHDAPTRSAIDQLRAGISRNQIKNPVVEGMQNRLVALGFMTSDEVARGPGFFGPKTEAALKAFQAKRGMEPNGILTYTAYQVLYATGG